MGITQLADLLPPLPAPPPPAVQRRASRPWPWERCAGKELDRPTPLDTDLMRGVEYLGVADAFQLAALRGGNVDWIERRLHLLFDTDYLERPDPQFTISPGDDKRRFRFEGWHKPIAYTLWPRGAEHLARVDGTSAAAMMKRVPSWDFFQHELETAGIMVGIEICCRNSEIMSYVPTEVFFPGERPHRGVQLSVGGRRTTTDWGPFALDCINGRRRVVILERDRQTEPKHRYSDPSQVYIAKKLECYESLRATWTADPGSSPVGTGDFVVLFPTTTAPRRDALASVAREIAGEHAGSYWFTDNATLGQWNVINPHDLSTNLMLHLPFITGAGETRTLAGW